MAQSSEARDRQYETDQEWLHEPTPTETTRDRVISVRLKIIELREKAAKEEESDPALARLLCNRATGMEDALDILFEDALDILFEEQP